MTINASRLSGPADHLALQTLVMSSSPLENSPITTGSSLSAKSGTTQEYFSWNSTSSVDNRRVTVNASTQQASGYVTVNLAYSTGGLISHNMLVGVVFGTTPLLTTNVLIGSSIAALLLFGLLLVAGRREYSRAYLGRNGF